MSKKHLNSKFSY